MVYGAWFMVYGVWFTFVFGEEGEWLVVVRGCEGVG
jgi:hypothetical protein